MVWRNRIREWYVSWSGERLGIAACTVGPIDVLSLRGAGRVCYILPRLQRVDFFYPIVTPPNSHIEPL
jgi:hypothetical protein